MKLLFLIPAILLCASCTKAPESTYLVYVTNEVSGDLTIIDPGTMEAVATVPLGKRPRGIHASPDGKTLYVALSGTPIAGPDVDESTLPPPDKSADGVGVFDVAQRKIVRTIHAGSDPENFDLSPDGSRIYISNEDDSALSVVDVAAGKVLQSYPVGAQPEGVRMSPDGSFVWTTSEETGTISVLDVARGVMLEPFKVGRRPRSIVFLSDGKKAYVNAENDGAVVIVDAAERRMTGAIPLGAPGQVKPMGLALSPKGDRLYVTTGRGKKLFTIDAATDKPVSELEVGQRPWGVAVSPDGSRIFTANGPSNDVALVDAATNTLLKRVPAGKSPWGVVAVPR